MTEDWKNKKEAFDAFDGRSEAWNFLPVVLKRAEKVAVCELDELFSPFVWNHGFGTFASEISPSALFATYLVIKEQEMKGKSRVDAMEALLDTFGEKNLEVGCFTRVKCNGGKS